MANPLAFNERRRVSSIDSVDLNRVYLGGRPRKPTEHLAQLLWKSVFSRADYVVDLHSAGPGEYLPFTAAPGGKCLDLARSINLNYIHIPQITKGGFLVDYCLQAEIQAFLVEVGGGRTLDLQYHEPVIDGLLNLLRLVEVLPGKVVEGPEPYVFRRKDLVPATRAGFFQPSVSLGQHIHEGGNLGTITPILGEAIQVQSPRDGTILYLRREPAVAEQESLVHLV